MINCIKGEFYQIKDTYDKLWVLKFDSITEEYINSAGFMSSYGIVEGDKGRFYLNKIKEIDHIPKEDMLNWPFILEWYKGQTDV